METTNGVELVSAGNDNRYEIHMRSDKIELEHEQCKLFYRRRPIRLASWTFGIILALLISTALVCYVVFCALNIDVHLAGRMISYSASSATVSYEPLVALAIVMICAVWLLVQIFTRLTKYIDSCNNHAREVVKVRLEHDHEFKKCLLGKIIGTGKEPNDTKKLDYRIIILKEKG